MTDERIREAERRWRASGSVEDEACYLLERLRAGALSYAQLQAAALLGYPAALSVVKQTVAGPLHPDGPAYLPGPVHLDNEEDEFRHVWPIEFAAGDDLSNTNDVRVVIMVQRRRDGLPIFVRPARATVMASDPRNNRVVVSVEVSAVHSAVGVQAHSAAVRYDGFLPNCEAMGFPHSFRGSQDGPLCELCGLVPVEPAAAAPEADTLDYMSPVPEGMFQRWLRQTPDMPLPDGTLMTAATAGPCPTCGGPRRLTPLSRALCPRGHESAPPIVRANYSRIR